MRIGIVFAMKEELAAFKAHFPSIEEKTLDGLVFYHVNHQNHDIAFVRSGVGKVNAAYTTTKLIEHIKPDVIFNSGVAGGIGQVHEGLVLGRSIVYHDVDVTSFGDYLHGQVPGLPAQFNADKRLLEHAVHCIGDAAYTTGTIASGDQFMTSIEPLKPTLKLYPDLLAVEMESAAIAHVATLAGIPFLIIRAISDQVGEPSQSEAFNTFLHQAAKKSAGLLYKMIDKPWR